MEQVQKQNGYEGPLILFDGNCSLCNSTVRFVLKHERHVYFRFSPLQSQFAEALLAEHPYPGNKPDSVLVWEEGRWYSESEAVFQILPVLGWHLRWMAIFRFLPLSFRNATYRFIARNRIRWFGKTAYCSAMQPEQKDRFTDLR